MIESMKGEMGNTTEIVRNIVLARLTEKSLISVKKVMSNV